MTNRSSIPMFPGSSRQGGMESRQSRINKNNMLNNITGHNGVRVHVTTRGIEIYGAAKTKELFNLYDVRATSVKVRGDIPDYLGEDDTSSSISNLDKAVYRNGAAVTHTESQKFDTEIDLDAYATAQGHTSRANFWLYILVDYTASDGTSYFSLKLTDTESTLVPATDQRIFPLWYISWEEASSGNHIGSIIDLRDTIHMDAADPEGSDDLQFAFKIEAGSTAGAINVLTGVGIRNQIGLAVTSLTNEAIAINTTKNVFLVFTNGSDSDLNATKPNAATLYVEGGYDKDEPHVFHVGTATNTAGVITAIFQTQLGYVDDHFYPGDTNFPNNPVSNSIEVRASNNTLQLYNFDAQGGGVSMNNSDHRIVIADNSAAPPEINYASPASLADYVAGYWNGGGTPAIEHAVLSFDNSSASTGKGGNVDHDNRYLMAIADKAAGLAHGAWGVDSGTYHTTGEMHAVAFKVQDRTANLWNKTNHTIDVLGAVSHTAATTLDLVATANDMTLTATAGAVDITAGATSAIAVVGNGELNLSTFAGEVTITAGGQADLVLESTGSAVNLIPASDLYINGTAGVTGGGFTKGIKTSDADFVSAVQEIHEMYG